MLAPAGFAAFLLGCWGYLACVPAEGGHHSLSDAIYGSAKLFPLHAAPQPETHVGYALDIARYLAPIVAGWAALIALIPLLRDRVQQMAGLSATRIPSSRRTRIWRRGTICPAISIGSLVGP